MQKKYTHLRISHSKSYPSHIFRDIYVYLHTNCAAVRYTRCQQSAVPDSPPITFPVGHGPCGHTHCGHTPCGHTHCGHTHCGHIHCDHAHYVRKPSGHSLTPRHSPLFMGVCNGLLTPPKTIVPLFEELPTTRTTLSHDSFGVQPSYTTKPPPPQCQAKRASLVVRGTRENEVAAFRYMTNLCTLR